MAAVLWRGVEIEDELRFDRNGKEGFPFIAGVARFGGLRPFLSRSILIGWSGAEGYVDGLGGLCRGASI